MIKIGKKIAIVTSFLVVSLYFFHQIESRHLPQSEQLVSSIITPVKAQEIDITKKSITDPLKEFLFGETAPLALLSNTKGLYLLDATGNVIKNEPDIDFYDLPVISYKNVSIDTSDVKLDDIQVAQCLRLLKTMRDFDYPLFNRISEIKIDRSLGMIAYLNNSGVPIIFGNGFLKRKVAYLSGVLPQLEDKQLLDLALYIDLRLDKQIIVKKRV